MSSEQEEVLTKNGFTFRRKRTEYKEIPDIKKIKRDDVTKVPEGEEFIPIVLREANRENKKEKETSTKGILKPSRVSFKPEEEKKPSDKIEYRKIKNIEVDPSKISKTKEDYRKGTGKENNAPEEKVEIKEIKKAPKLHKLPSYPTTFTPIEFDLDEYEKIDPFRRLEKMLSDLNLQEKKVLQKEYKDYPVFLDISTPYLNFLIL